MFTTAQLIAIAVFIGVMALVVSEKVHRCVAALAGAMILIFTGVLDFDTGISHIDFNTIGVLLGMMLFVAVVKESGLFEYVAIKSAKIAKGDPWRIMVAFIIITALLSALLDNVTTVLLVGPMTYTVCKTLKINPVPFFMTEIMASNIGGTSTLIGDPPNIMIGSAAGLSFADFISVDAPAVIIILVVVTLVFKFVYGRKMKVADEDRAEVMKLNEKDCIRDLPLFKKSIFMICAVAVGFMCHGALGVDSSVIALSAACIMLLVGKADLDLAVFSVEWTTIGFFCGLFIVVGGLSETGVISMIAQAIMDATADQALLMLIVILWASAFISSILDNIPFVATMIPVVTAIGATGVDVAPLWWGISLGACLGGNGTLIGASANVVLSSISARDGHPITFIDYFKVGFPIMILTVAIATVYLLVRFGPELMA